MTMWTPRNVGFETGRSAHYEGPILGAAATVAGGPCIGLWLCQGRSDEPWNV